MKRISIVTSTNMRIGASSRKFSINSVAIPSSALKARTGARYIRPTQSVGKRYTQNLNETSWAGEALKKQGENLEKPKEAIYMDDNFYKNPSDKIKDIVQQILQLNVVEINQMMTMLQQRLGISDERIYMETGINRHGHNFSHIDAMRTGGGGPAAGGAAAAAPAAAAPVAEKTSFDLKLGAVDAKAKIKIIKEVRTITGLGLKEAKELVEKAPVVIKQGLKKEDVENFKKLLLDAGAVVEVL